MSATGEAGFTLLEMLVTLAISALLAGIGFPALHRVIDHVEFQRTVADIRSALRQARAMAIRREGPVAVVLTADRQLAAGGQLLSGPLQREVRVAFNPGPAMFYSDGSANELWVRVASAREVWTARLAGDGILQ